MVEGLKHGFLTAMQQRQALGPARGDIGQDQAVEIAAFRTGAAVRDEVGLQTARLGVVPVGEGAHRHVVFEQRAGLGGRDAARLVLPTPCPQQPIRCRRADTEQLRPHLAAHVEMAMPFQRGDQLGQKGHQPLRADLIGGGPGHFQRGLHLGAVPSRAWSREGLYWRQVRLRQESNGVLARIAGDGDKLVEDVRLLAPRRVTVATGDLCQELAFRLKTHG